MGKIQFNIPDDVVRRLEEVFEGQDKDAVVTDLLRKAAEASESPPRLSLVEQSRRIRAMASRTYSDEEIQAIREELRE